MNLVCRSPASIGLITTAYFIGYGFGGIVFYFPDKYGRRISSIGGLLLALLSMTLMLLLPNYYIRVAGFFFLGLCNIKDNAAPIWASEMVGKDPKHKSTAYSIINAADASPLLVVYGYILLGGVNWLYLYIGILCIGYTAFVILLVCPESPEWYLH